MLSRIRKALAAGIGGGIAAAAGIVFKAGKLDRETVSQMLGAFLVGAVTVGWAAWRVPNAKPLAPYSPR